MTHGLSKLTQADLQRLATSTNVAQREWALAELAKEEAIQQHADGTFESDDAKAAVFKGDVDDHSFHGNQWTGGEGGPKDDDLHVRAHAVVVDLRAAMGRGEDVRSAWRDTTADERSRGAALREMVPGKASAAAAAFHNIADERTQAKDKVGAKAARRVGLAFNSLAFSNEDRDIKDANAAYDKYVAARQVSPEAQAQVTGEPHAWQLAPSESTARDADMHAKTANEQGEFIDDAFTMKDNQSDLAYMAVDRYQLAGGADAGVDINEALRSGALSENDREQVRGLDEAIRGVTTVEPMTLFRGLALGFLPAGIQAGYSFKDLGYGSTSFYFAEADRYVTGGQGQGQKLQISLASGSHALPMIDDDAGEVLLPRGTTYTVTGIAADGTILVDAKTPARAPTLKMESPHVMRVRRVLA